MYSGQEEGLLTMRKIKLFNRTFESVPRKRKTMQQVRSHGPLRQSVQESTKATERTEATAAAGELGRGGIRK